MLTGTGLLSLLVTLVIAGLIFWLIWWFIGQVGLPEPFNKVATVIVALASLIYLIGLLTGTVPTLKLG
jgi:hypothetical protein